MQLANRKLLLAGVAVTVALICVFLVGYFVRAPRRVLKLVDKTQKVQQPNRDLHRDIITEMAAENMEKNLRYYAGEPHAAGSDRNNELGDEMFQRFKSYGFQAKKESMTVLLSYPKKSKPNKVSILDKNGTTKVELTMMEDKLATDEDISKSLPPFLAYAKAGVVEGDLVYVNYGRDSDFKYLQDTLKINVTGKIVLARYGKIGRGGKARYAEKYGAVAALLYHDPENYAPNGAGPMFPHGWWLSDDGAQRGSIFGGAGDPLTPYYPSTDDAYRIDKTSPETGMPNIPCQPLSMRDGKTLLQHLAGAEAPKDWQGQLGLKYHLGPGFSSNWTLKVEVYNERVPVRITNVFGTIQGAVEPDRYVLVGNHRDAWVNGAADPSSGTSVMMEIARAIGTKVNSGWRPYRSITFCSWDGEEAGLIGSIEWTEQHAKLLQNRAVAYINLDTVVFGNFSLGAAASPLMQDVFFKATKEVEDAHDSSITVFDKYKDTYPSRTRPGYLSLRRLGAGSDYYAFYHHFGIPSLDLSYRMPDLNQKFNTSFYPVYHTLHDTFTWMKNFVDPKFRCHLTLGRVAASTLLKLADTPLIPWRINDMAIDMKEGLTKLDEFMKKSNASLYHASTGYLEKAVLQFGSGGNFFHDLLETAELTHFPTLRMANDVLMQVEKGFVYPGGLPTRRDYSHMIYSPPTLFPTIRNAVAVATKNASEWKNVKKQISIVASTIESVTETLFGGFEV